MRRGPRAALVAAAVLAATATGCSDDAPSTATPGAVGAAPATTVAADVDRYVSLGSDEALRSDVEDPLRTMWTQQVFSRGLPTSAEYVNLATPLTTVADAAATQGPAALALEPTVVTAWFGYEDAVAGTTPADFGASLQSLVEALGDGGVDRIVLLRATSGPPAIYADVTAEVAERTGAALVTVDGDPFTAVSPEQQTAIADAVIAEL